VFDIIVIGGTNIDIKAKTTASYISATSNPGNVTFTPGGVGRNIAHNLGSLGVSVALISAIGNDAPGEIAMAATGAAGVDLSMCLRCDAASGAYVAVLDEKGELVSAVNDMRILENLKPENVKPHHATLQAAKLIVVDCNTRPDLLDYLALHFSEQLVVEPVSVAKSQKLRTLLEKHEVFMATPNRDQLQALTDIDDMDQACLELHERGLQNLVVHMGSEGALLSLARGMKKIPATCHAQVLDVTGAGDAAVAGLVYGLSKGYDIAKSAQFGQAAASLVLSSTSSTVPGLTETALLNIVKARHDQTPHNLN
jgi:pseudouridine kinase